jgi:hypothetical protein
MNKPNLFIVGAARSGTTSLWQYLKTHPAVYMPEDELLKEPTFFSRDGGPKLELNDYLSIFKQAATNRRWIGEASVAYLTDPETASRLYEFNPAAKIIIMLRNPANRAFSLYNWMAQEGYEYASSFQEALKLEETRVNQRKPDWYKPNYYWGYLYFRSGLYHDQVKRYLELFKENVLLIKFEDFARDPRRSYREVCSFLQIPDVPFSLHIYNPSQATRSAKILFILRKLNNYIIRENKGGAPLKKISEDINGVYRETVDKLARVASLGIHEKFLGKAISKKVAGFLKNFPQPYPYKEIISKQERDRLVQLGLKAGKSPALKNRIRKHLLKKYAPDIEKLSGLTGLDWSDWLKD